MLEYYTRFFMLKFKLVYYTKISCLNIHAVFLNKNSSYINWYNIPKDKAQTLCAMFHMKQESWYNIPKTLERVAFVVLHKIYVVILYV